MLDTQKQGLLALVRAALTGEKQALPEDFRLENVYEAILQHNIVVMALEGALKCGLTKSDPTVAKLFRLAFRAIGIVEAQDKTAAALFAAFEDAQIDFMPIKGAVLRGMYPKPEYRSMGDMDVLIKLEQYGHIREVMLAQGFEEQHETDNELVWKNEQLYLELHKYPMPRDNDDYYRYYGENWPRACAGNTSRYTMVQEDHFIFVFVHFAKHYRGGGVGIRQMCDIWVMRQKQPDMDEAYIRAELNKLGLLKFYENTLLTLAAWFDGAAFNDITEFITEVIYASGVFGNEKEYALSLGARMAKGKPASKMVRYKRLLQRVFLPKTDMEYRYPFLKKAPVLLPVMWVYRGCYILIKEPKKIRRERDRFHLLSNGEIDAYQESLSYVGLKYD